MGISFGGINTGLPPNLVDQLVDAERIPIRNIEAKKGKTENKLKLVTELDTKLRSIQDNLKELAGTRGFNDIKLMSGDPNVVQGTIDPGVAPKGNWNIEVVRLASKAAGVSNGFPDKDVTEIGVGYFSFKTPDGTKDVYINGSNNTLEGAAKAINAANIGVRATVINDRKDPDAPFRLMVTGDSLGSDNTVSFPTLYFLDGDQDFYFDEKRPSENGIIKVDGYEMEIADNTVRDVIPGVTLELKQAQPGKSVNVSVKEDMEVVHGKIKKFVESTNEVLKFIQTQNQMNEKTDTTQTLGGDGLLRTIENDLRRLLQDPQYGINGDIKRLGQIGIGFNRNGTLNFDEDKFNAVLGKNVAGVQEFFAGDGFTSGFIPAVRRTIGGLIDNAFGPVANRKRGLQDQVAQADKRIDDMEKRLASKEKQLRSQFARLEETMSKLKSQGAMLNQRLGGDGGGGFNLSGGSTSKS